MLVDKFELVKDNASTLPISRQIAEALKQAIINNQIGADVVLPSVRDIARELQISRSTAARAIDELSAQGYVIAEMGSCSRVAPHLPGKSADLPARITVEREADLSRFAQTLQSRFDCGAVDLKINYTGPVLREFPLATWRDLLVRHCKAATEEETLYVPEPFGYSPLREAYTSYLIRARAVKVTKDRLVTFASRNLRLDLIARLLLNPGDTVAMEDPGFPAAREQLLAAGATLIPIGVDSQGLLVDQLQALETPPRLIYVTPSHQAPTGAVMSMIRRKQLLQYAARHKCYIIEDDYDSEFRYDGRPLPSLQGMDCDDRTIYFSCLWNVMAPVSRIGFMVVPEALVEAMSAAKSLVERDVSMVEQAAVTDFINEGHLEKQIRRQRSRYASRRENVLNLLEELFVDSVWTAPESAGLDLLVRFNETYDSLSIEEAAVRSNLPLQATRKFYQGEPRAREYVIPFASMEEDDFRARIEKFHALLKA
ncbi:MAG: PLP-dependent aminotransferase family protein [Cyanobacteria bacterium SZAS LIN-2]|nr:PLP-dependent aminotransferase family protein [Cyanobacteria bacterium SZAS LIN-3]MBS1996013.1 PLP-dependent aminotransferase family protein [Cyanobacteria bacterium SZAS LIN-2]